MNAWDLVTWVAVAVLGPGAIVIFAAFVRDLVRPAKREPAATPPSDAADA
jgi:hypothetical protein